MRDTKLWVWTIHYVTGFLGTKNVGSGVGKVDTFTRMCGSVCGGWVGDRGWTVHFLAPPYPKGSTTLPAPHTHTHTHFALTYFSKWLFSSRQNLYHRSIYNTKIQSTVRKAAAFSVLCIKCLLLQMATHSSTPAWKIPWTEELGRIQSLGSRRVGHDWATSLSLFTFMHWRRKWQPTPVFLPGESRAEEHGGLPSMGSHRAGHDWSDLAAAAAADYYSLPVPKKYTTYFSSGFFPGTRSFRHIDWCVIIHTETRARTHTHTHTHTHTECCTSWGNSDPVWTSWNVWQFLHCLRLKRMWGCH